MNLKFLYAVIFAFLIQPAINAIHPCVVIDRNQIVFDLQD
ncbi:MAG: hypothetical protein JWM99_316 [Verrucomicrobiales bacterium]|nr:hypothetical protein [Verrucomicrobiales bacterium]